MPISWARTSRGSSSAVSRRAAMSLWRDGALAARVLLKADGGVDREAVDEFRGLGGNFLDVDATSSGGHDEREADGVVDDDAQVELTVHLELLLHEDAA